MAPKEPPGHDKIIELLGRSSEQARHAEAYHAAASAHRTLEGQAAHQAARDAAAMQLIELAGCAEGFVRNRGDPGTTLARLDDALRPMFQMRDAHMDNIGEWTPAIEKPPARLRERAQIVRHMILPAWSVVLGVVTLFGLIRWLSGELPGREIDGPLSLVIGGSFTALGGWELRFWRRRLRELRAPAVADAE